jgi:hypothetical protein
MSLLASAPTGADWSESYHDALAAARKAQRPMLVVLEDPAEPERRVEQAACTPSLKRTRLLGRYQLCRVDITTPTGKKVAEAFGAEQFPHTAITDAGCKKIVFRKTGRFKSRDWWTMLASHGIRGKRRHRTTSPLPRGINQDGNCFT